ncbi:MAG: TIM barrel protein [Hyphomicrobiales bacterium]
MTSFSANLGFLWTELTLPDAIRAAHRAGFSAVECHWPYAVPAQDVRAALDETGLPMLGLNTGRGNVENGDNGLSAICGREAEAQAAIDEAIAYADVIDAAAIHVMAGFASGEAAHHCFVKNLSYAADQTDRTILIEPLNRNDAPNYFLSNTEQAAQIITAVGKPNLKLMFDCYHVGRTEGDLITRLKDLLPVIGHVQFASVPDRGAPDHGEINYEWLFPEIDRLGWTQPLGAEYKTKAATEATLGWLNPAEV